MTYFSIFGLFVYNFFDFLKMGSQIPTQVVKAESVEQLVQWEMAEVAEEPQIGESEFVEQISAENKRNAQRRKSSDLGKSQNIENDCSPVSVVMQQPHSPAILQESNQKVNKKCELPPLKSTRKYVGDIIFFHPNDQVLEIKKKETQKVKKVNENTQAIIFEDMEQEDDQINREQNLRGYLHHRSKKFRPQKIHT